jgi:hypothetical protein
LRWINAAISNFGQSFKMIQLGKQKTAAARARIEPEINMAAVTELLGLSTVPAVWPTGASQLAQAIESCQRCDTAGRGLNVKPTRRLF